MRKIIYSYKQIKFRIPEPSFGQNCVCINNTVVRFNQIRQFFKK